MKTMSAAKFKEQCLSLMDQVTGDGIVITKHGRPVARLMPVTRSPAELIGCMKGKIKVRGNIMSTGIKWNAES